MGKHTTFIRQPEKMKREVHPIWRGIGFIFIILTPVLSYVATLLLLQENAKAGWFQIPADLYVKYSDPLILVKAVSTLVICLALFAVLMMITFILYRLFAPPRYGPFDVPPTAYKGKSYKR